MRSRKERKSPEDFVRIWQTATDLEGAAEKLGCSITAAVARAKTFRKKGIPLKELKKKDGFNVELLRKLAIQLANEQKQPADPKKVDRPIPETIADHLAAVGPMKSLQIAKDLEVSVEKVEAAFKTHKGWFTRGTDDNVVRLTVGGMAESRRRRGLEAV